jgi:hypothetical protein
MKITSALLGLAALTLTASLEAASIKYAVLVPGYSTAGWIQVRPELRSLLGGRVAYLPQYGGWVTDRAARGEAIRTTIAPNRAGEGQGTLAAITLKINGVPVIPTFTAPLTFVGYRTVSTNPNDDNISVTASTGIGAPTVERVPIGSR